MGETFRVQTLLVPICLLESFDLAGDCLVGQILVIGVEADGVAPAPKPKARLQDAVVLVSRRENLLGLPLLATRLSRETGMGARQLVVDETDGGASTATQTFVLGVLQIVYRDEVISIQRSVGRSVD